MVQPDAQLNILLCRDACQGVDFTNNCYLCDRKANQWVSAEEKFSFHQSKLADYAHDQPRWLPLQPYGRQVLEKESSSAFARVKLYRGWLKQKLCSATTARKRYQICNLQSLRTFFGDLQTKCDKIWVIYLQVKWLKQFQGLLWGHRPTPAFTFTVDSSPTLSRRPELSFQLSTHTCQISLQL